MFPEVEVLEENSEELTGVTELGKSFLFDFKTGDFILIDGKPLVVEGLDALKVWIEKILKTEKFKFKIYETGEENEYGASLLDLVNSGYPQPFVEEEIKREITEALERNPELISIESFIFSREKRTLVCSFTVNTIYNTSFTQEVSL